MQDLVFRNLNQWLRMFAAPVVALIGAQLIDPDHDTMAMLVILGTHQEGNEMISWWPVVGLILGCGPVIYYSHRTLWHPLFNHGQLAVKQQLCKKLVNDDLTVLHFDKARNSRRKADNTDPARKWQDALDERNAVAHFFWCSGFAVASIPWIVWIMTAEPVSLKDGWPVFALAAPFFALAIWSDVGANFADIHAFNAYPDHR